MKKVLATLILFGPPTALITFFALKMPSVIALLILFMLLAIPLILFAVHWALNQFGR